MRRNITLHDLREIQLKLLDSVHDFCIKHNLRYSLGGGTLLGAIRHNGFIPWDDDVDIMMPRPDYEFFLKEFRDHNIKIQHPNTDSQVFIPFAKVYDDRTVLIEHYAENGVFIDLFPIDGLPEEALLIDYLKIQQRAIDYLYKIHDYEHKQFYGYEPNHSKFFVGLKHWIKQLFYPSRDKCFDTLHKLHLSHDFETSKYAGAICGAYAEKEHMLQNTFLDYVLKQFENRSYMCISAYDSYLTKHYGDYMQLPPLEHRKGSHHFVAYWKE